MQEALKLTIFVKVIASVKWNKTIFYRREVMKSQVMAIAIVKISMRA